jgi:hypothetical protein
LPNFQDDLENVNWQWFSKSWLEDSTPIIEHYFNDLIEKTKEHLQKVSDVDFGLSDRDPL